MTSERQTRGTQTCPSCGEQTPSFGTRCAYCAEDIAQAKAAAALSGPTKPGWYADPTMAETRRYWDGAQWSEHVAPADRKARTGTEAPTRWAWVLAVLPLLAAGATPGAVDGVTVAYIVAAVVVGIVDQKLLERHGVVIVPVMVLFPPVYLIVRTIKAGSSRWILTTFAACAVIGGLAAAVVSGS